MNEMDVKLIEFCKGQPKTIKKISDYLKIAIKNVWVKVRALEKEGQLMIIKKDKFLKKAVVQTKQNKEFLNELRRLLKIIKSNGGTISTKELYDKSFRDTDSYSPKGYLIQQAIFHIKFSDFTEEKISLTKEGEQFLKKFSKKI